MPNCRHTRLTVVKTIRLHFNGLLSWIRKHPTLKVLVWLSVSQFYIDTLVDNSPHSRSKVPNEIQIEVQEQFYLRERRHPRLLQIGRRRHYGWIRALCLPVQTGPV